MKSKQLLTSFTFGLGLTLALLWLLVAGSTTPVYADTFEVTNLNASGPGSLRQAILDANSNAGHDTIDFGVNGTIVLTAALPAITDTLTIAGPGAEQLAVSGNNAHRVFEISAGGAVTITGLTAQEGNAVDGGGIWSAGTLHLENARVISNTASSGSGGGMCNISSSPTLSNVTFSGNQAGVYGGGIFNDIGSHPALNNVIFSGNAAAHGGGMFNWSSNPTLNNVAFSYNQAVAGHGGGMYNYSGSNPTLSNVTFSGNAAVNGYSGGMHNYSSSNPTLTDVIFSGNWSSGDYWHRMGGGMGNDASSPTLNNVIFSGNYANRRGGGMYNYNNSSPTLNNVTFSGNWAGSGGGMFNGYSSPKLNNTILWGNAGGNMTNWNSSPVISYSLVEGGCPSGATCNAPLLAKDPQFVAPLPASAAPTTDGNYRLQSTSPAINAGNNAALPGSVTTDLDGNPRILSGQVDLGPYEFFSGLIFSKQADDPYPVAGQRVTYTLTALNGYAVPITGAVISDTLPAGLSFAGPITLDPPDAGTVGSAPPFLAYNLSITAGERITVTFPVTVAEGLPAGTVITNTAAITSIQTPNPITVQHVLTVIVPGVIYVDHDATGSNNGASWADAYTTVQDALNAAGPDDEIWVAQGVYTPTNTVGRSATFALPQWVSLYGGFAATETLRSQRNWAANVTVLSGDLDGNDTATPDGVVTHTDHITGANAYHVVTPPSRAETVVLDGFTITAGQANGAASNDHGGGMYNNDYSSPTLNNVAFSGNQADEYGGGMFNGSNSSPTLNNVVFNGNYANWGGGMFNLDSSPTLNNAAFSGNQADYGGGIHNYSSSPMLNNVAFSGNQAVNGHGGGMSNFLSSPTLNTVTFSGNRANEFGGGLYVDYGSATLIGTQVLSNSADRGGGLYVNYGSATLTGTQVISNQADYGGGLYIAQNSGVITATNGCIVYNGDTAVDNAGSGALNAADNWWGAADGPSGAGPGSGDSVSAGVTYANYKTSPPAGCPTHTPDLSIAKSVTPILAAPGESVTYTLVFSNIAAKGLAEDVVITDIIPVSVTNVSVISGGAAITRRAGTSYAWDVADLGPGKGGVITISGVLCHGLSASPLAGGTFTNTATITTPGDSDSGNNSASASVTAENVAPVLAPIGSRSVDEGSLLSFTATATDDNGDPLTYSLRDAPAGAAIGSASGVFTWTPSEAQGPGNYTLTVVVSDTVITDSERIAITVNAVNQAPSISDIPNQSTDAGVAVGPIPFTVGDAETDAGSLAVGGDSSNPALAPPANITFGGSGTARTVTLTPATGLTGTATITISVSDGELTAHDTFVLAVDANSPPEFTSIPVETATVGMPYTYAIVTYDADPKDALTITAPVSATWLTLTQATSRTATLSGTPIAAGDYPVELQVTDGQDSATQAFTITVPAPNQSPIADAGDAQTVAVNATVTLDGSGSSDPDGDTLTYRWTQTGGPSVSFAPGISVTTFTAPASDAVLTFALVVTDVHGLASAPDEVLVTVTSSPFPVLRVFKSVDVGGQTEVPVDGIVTYTLVISNSGTGVAGGVVLTDPLPSGVSFGGWVGGHPGTVTLPGPDTLDWRGDVGAGVEYTLVFTATVGAEASGTVVNTAYYRSDGVALQTASDAGFTVESGYDVYLPLVARNN